ncbi:Pre-mRNA splicing factor-domain-containing protein [Geranomyces variabilis]|nr:Pre-mRNA splicing factor-domain-containing protein [Geranomyces variabilis]KAJ3136909.1 RNA-splicing factor [Geranomyces variabilis]
MGGGDLNLKKSWHPGTLRNQEKVWKRERDADEEKKKLDQLLKEKMEERQMMELQALNEATGKAKKRSERLDWMYSAGPGGSKAIVDEEREAYLLGKRRVDRVVESAKTVEEMDGGEQFARANAYGMTANTVRDTQNKIREDPMLAIKKREHASLQSVLNNPVELKRLKQSKSGSKAERKEERRKAKLEKKEKREHQKAKRGLSGDEREETYVDRRQYGDASRKRPRSPSFDRRSRSPHRHDGRRRTPSYDRWSRSPPPMSRSHRRYGRSPSPHRVRTGRRQSPSMSPVSRDVRRRSPSLSPVRSRRRSLSPPPPLRSRRLSPSHEAPRRRSPLSPRRRPISPPPPHRRPSISAPNAAVTAAGTSGRPNVSSATPTATEPTAATPAAPAMNEDRAARLAAMQADATEWDRARSERVAADRLAEQSEQLADDVARKQRLMGKNAAGSFLQEMQRNTISGGGVSAADMITRNRAMVQRGGGGFLEK